MSNTKVFTKLDARNACWQTPADEERFNLLTFNSPNGKHGFLLMPYDIHFASNVWKCRISQMLGNKEGATKEQNGIKELTSRAISILKSLRTHGPKLNKVNVNSTNFKLFLGHRITRQRENKTNNWYGLSNQRQITTATTSYGKLLRQIYFKFILSYI